MFACGRAAGAQETHRATASARERTALNNMLYSRRCCRMDVCFFDRADPESLDQVITDAERIGHDGQSGVNSGAGREETAVYNVQIVDLVRLAIRVQGRRLGVTPEADRAVLVRHACKWNAVSDEQIPREQSFMTFMAMNVAFGLLLHEHFELREQTAMWLFVVRCVLENDFPFAIEGDAIVGVRQILRGDPEAEGVLGHEVQRPAGSNGWSARGERRSIQLCDEGDVAHGVIPLFGAKVKVV